MSPGERLQNARLPVSSTKRKNPEGVAEASASAQVSHRRVMQLVVPIEQMIFEAGAGDDARTGKILAELQKSLAIAIHGMSMLLLTGGRHSSHGRLRWGK